MRGRGEIRVKAERELHETRQTLTRYPATVRTIMKAANRLRRPVDALSPADVEPNDSQTRRKGAGALARCWCMTCFSQSQ